MNSKLTTYYLLLTTLLGFAHNASADLPPPTIIDKDKVNEWLIAVGNFMLGAGMVLAVIVIVYAGIRWMTAGADSKATGEARSILISGIWGVGIILGVGLIIKTVMAIVTGTFFN